VIKNVRAIALFVKKKISKMGKNDQKWRQACVIFFFLLEMKINNYITDDLNYYLSLIDDEASLQFIRKFLFFILY
jgi:hypothetical protein